MRRPATLAGATLVLAAASIVAWALAYPQGSLPLTLVRAIADCAAVVCLGLAAVPMLDDERYRPELIGRATAPLSVAGAVWLVAELGRLIVAAAQAAAVPIWRLGVPTTVDFAWDTAPGRAGALSVAAAATLCLATVAAPRTAPLDLVVAGLAAVGLTSRLITGSLLRECARRSGPCSSHSGGGAVVWRAGRPGTDRRASRSVGPGAATVLAGVAVVCTAAVVRRCSRGG